MLLETASLHSAVPSNIPALLDNLIKVIVNCPLDNTQTDIVCKFLSYYKTSQLLEQGKQTNVSQFSCLVKRKLTNFN